MTNTEKLNRLLERIPEDDRSSVGDSELLILIEEAGELILNKMYPFGMPSGATVPSRYDNIQIQIALELFNRRGAEGEMSHSENGTVRSYEGGSISASLLKRVASHCGSAVSVESEAGDEESGS